MLASMSAPQFDEWLAFYELEPFGQTWKQTAYVCTMVANGAGGKKNGGSYNPTEFLPVQPPKPPPLTEEQQAAEDARHVASWSQYAQGQQAQGGK